MKFYALLLASTLVLASLTGCLGMLAQKPKTYNTSITPSPEFSASRQVIKTDLKIIIDAGVKDPFKLSRGEDLVLIEVANFRDSVLQTVKKALTPQFNNVTTSDTEDGKGLKLVILSATYPDPVDVMAFHFALMNDGKLAYEFKGETTPITKIVQMSPNTWQDETSKITIEFLESNINEMAEQTRDQLLINDKLKDFWAQYENI